MSNTEGAMVIFDVFSYEGIFLFPGFAASE